MASKEQASGLNKLFEEQLRDIYYAEKQILKALPKMAKAATDPDLKAGFEQHHKETQEHISRLEQVFDAIGRTARGKNCPAIDGILEEGTELMHEFSDDPALDAGLVAAAQKVEHYEIASYSSMIAWAEQLGMDDVVGLLNETLEEEKETDEKLTTVSQTVNAQAMGEEEEMAGSSSNGHATARKAATGSRKK